MSGRRGRNRNRQMQETKVSSFTEMTELEM